MNDSWQILDVFLRGGAVSALLICGAMFVLSFGITRKSVSIAALCTGLMAYMLVSSPVLMASGLSVERLLIPLAGTVPVLLYWASLELFLDDVEFSGWQVILCTLVVVGAWLASLMPFADLLRGASVIALFCHLLFVIIASAESDLVEGRRRCRRWFLIIVVVVVVAITAIELTKSDEDLSAAIYAFHALIFLGLSSVFVIWSARIPADFLIGPLDTIRRSNTCSPAEMALAAKAEAAMADGIWREEGLTIGALANRMQCQEHRLRRAINHVLGYRNFPSFINGYRIESAKQLLANPDQSEVAILSIAYEVGFSSLGPFNKAFRDATGTTPSEYRRRAISNWV